jgi:ribosomal protein S18 acetylase RimI-like enzyme
MIKTTFGALRKMLRESVESVGETKEEFDGRSWIVTIEHPRTFNLPNGESLTVPAYTTSQIRAKVHDDAGELELTHIHVSPEHQKKGLARKMISMARDFAAKKSLKIVTSGVYSADGAALMKSLEKSGEARASSRRHEL